jgi:hypothetical protein
MNLMKAQWMTNAILLTIALFLGVIALRPVYAPDTIAQAQAARFDHVYIAASGFLYKGQQGLLVMDRRNGNVWFIGKTVDRFLDPVFVIRMPFEKLDEAPR